MRSATATRRRGSCARGASGGARPGARPRSTPTSGSGRCSRATGLRMRFEFPDATWSSTSPPARTTDNLALVVRRRADWRPKLELEMDSEVANRYLQGRESLAIAIARGQVALPRRVADRAPLPAGRAADLRARTGGWSRPTTRSSRGLSRPRSDAGVRLTRRSAGVGSVREDGNRPLVGRAARALRRLGLERRVRKAPQAPKADEAGREARRATGPTRPRRCM